MNSTTVVSNYTTDHHPEIDPATTSFVVLSFEGPDDYARRGRLATSVEALCAALTNRGFHTTLIFPGDPKLPFEETSANGRLHIVRQGRWISRYFPGGPYDGQDYRIRDFTDGVSLFINDMLNHAPQDMKLVVIGHEWQTAEVMKRLSNDLKQRGQRHRAILLWMMRHALNIQHTDLRGLVNDGCTVTTVSRFLKHELWKSGVDPLVLPAGLSAESFKVPSSVVVDHWHTMGIGRLLLWKPGGWTGGEIDDRVLQMLAELKRLDRRPLLILDSDLPLPLAERAIELGLHIHDEAALVHPGQAGTSTPSIDIVTLDRPLDAEECAALTRAATATLVVGEDDPTGVAILEEMAHGGVVLTDNAMCDALIPLINSLPIETPDVAEMVAAIIEVAAHPEHSETMRRFARQTAESYAWEHVLDNLLAKLEFLSLR